MGRYGSKWLGVTLFVSKANGIWEDGVWSVLGYLFGD